MASISTFEKNFAKLVLTPTCTSAACERVFSRVDALYGRDQLCVLGDQLQAAVMLRYNQRMVA